METAYIFDAIRTPRGLGKKTGSFYEVKPVELLKTLLLALQKRQDMDTTLVEDCLIGTNAPIGEQGGNIARTACLYAGWQIEVPGLQVNRFGASGLETVNLAAAKIRSGWNNLIVAGGVESMSRIPLGADGGAMMLDTDVSRKIAYIPHGVSADLIATMEGFSRSELDEVAVLSHQKALAAQSNGWYKNALIPVKDQNGVLILDKDESVREEVTLESLSILSPAFANLGQLGYNDVALQKYYEVEQIRHLHHVGNCAPMVDGAALILVGNETIGVQLNKKPRARILAAAAVGTDSTAMLTGAAPAAKKALKMVGMNLKDIDLIEVNEGFAAVVLKFMKDMGLDNWDKLNINGGAIALGHPMGATGAILLGTLLDELERRNLKTGLVAMPAAGGMGVATIIERV